MFYKHYSVKFGGVEHRAVLSAMMGENPETLERVIYYSFIDYTFEPFDDATQHDMSMRDLAKELTEYGYIPFKDNKLEGEEGSMDKKAKVAFKKNEMKRKELMNRAKLIPQLGEIRNDSGIII